MLGLGRESRENEKNLEESNKPGEQNTAPRRGRMANGPSRGGGSGRGGRGGGRLGSRTFQSRDGGPSRNNYGPRPVVDMWDANAVSNDTGNENDFPSPIDDWYNEEYTGSLTETKVFTPSTAMEAKEAKERGTSGPGMGRDTDGGTLINYYSAFYQPLSVFANFSCFDLLKL